MEKYTEFRKTIPTYRFRYDSLTHIFIFVYFLKTIGYLLIYIFIGRFLILSHIFISVIEDKNVLLDPL